jgi:hypothetical protein
MLLNAMTIFVAFLLASTPLLGRSPVQTAITLVAAAVAAVAAAMSCLDRRYRSGIAAAGALLALSAFAFTDDVATSALQLAVGYGFFAAGLAPAVVRQAPAAAAREAYQPEERRAA